MWWASAVSIYKCWLSCKTVDICKISVHNFTAELNFEDFILGSWIQWVHGGIDFSEAVWGICFTFSWRNWLLWGIASFPFNVEPNSIEIELVLQADKTLNRNYLGQIPQFLDRLCSLPWNRLSWDSLGNNMRRCMTSNSKATDWSSQQLWGLCQIGDCQSRHDRIL